jgi:hypothetical protein
MHKRDVWHLLRSERVSIRVIFAQAGIYGLCLFGHRRVGHQENVDCEDAIAVVIIWLGGISRLCRAIELPGERTNHG